MQKLWSRILTLVGSRLARRRAPANSGTNSPLDWLPPVLGPGDWSIGLMADGGANWYFERR
jgi:hypothetical protein